MLSGHATFTLEGKDWAGAVAYLAEGVERYPDHAGMLYSLACYEALAGHHADVLAHLSRAVELDPKVAAWAEKDDDLASIRDDQRFPTS